MNLALLPIVVIGSAVGFGLIDFIYWLVWGRRENKADRAREARLDELVKRVAALGTATHAAAMAADFSPTDFALNLADTVDLLASVVDELEAA